MLTHKTSPSLVRSLLLLVCAFSQAAPVEAGCGCDKVPPPPSVVSPHVAFPGLPISLADEEMKVGQQWTVTFRNGLTTTTVLATVITRRDVADASGNTLKRQLVVPLPNLPLGPTRIVASNSEDSFVVSETAFTVIAPPVKVAARNTRYEVERYATAVGADGTLYFGVSGLNQVCDSMKFKAVVEGYLLRFGYGDVAIVNWQGFFIDTLGIESAEHFQVEPNVGLKKSDTLHYFRHSFARYCTDHLPGGAKAIDPTDPNWHRDGTPHVDYATLIFAIAGHFDDGSTPKKGPVSFKLVVETDEGEGWDTWESEHEEEAVLESLDDPDDSKNSNDSDASVDTDD